MLILHSFLELTTNENLKVKPSKIVAGHEPEKTNELLQAIGKALDKKLDSSEAVDMVKSGKIPVPKATSKPSNKTTIPSIKSIDASKKKPVVNVTKVSQSKPKPKDDKVNVLLKTKKPISDEKTKEKGRSNKEKVDSTKRPIKVDDIKTVVPIKDVSKHLNDEPIIVPPIAEPNKESVIEILATNPIEIQTNPLENDIIHQDNQLNELDEDVIEINNKDLVSEPLPEEPSIIAMTEEIKPAKIPTSQSADELVDVIDQEAERRRKEKSERRRKERKKSPEIKSEIVNNIENVIFSEKIENALPSPKISIEPEKPKNSKKKKSENSTNEIVPKKINVAAPTSIQEAPTPIQEAPTIIRPRTSLRPPSVRPASARPGAPRRRERNIEIILPPEENVKMAGINVKMDSFNTDLDDEGENLIIIEDPLVEQNILAIESTVLAKDNMEGSQQGHLVQQILETQKEFSKIENNTKEPDNRTDIVSLFFGTKVKKKQIY